MSIIGSNILAGASGQGGGGAGYTIENSLRFRSSASAYLNRTQTSTATSGRTYTISFWVKRGKLGVFQCLWGTPTNYEFANFQADDTFRISNPSGTPYWVTSQVFRDPSAWYHLVMAFDTTQATASNRLRVYVNGVEITSWTSNPTITQNATAVRWNVNGQTNYIGQSNSSGYADVYISEFNSIDGQQLDPSSFGEYNADTGVWQPVAYEGTYGTNGFYLPFSDNTNTTTLVADSSGNGNDWTPNNISLTSGATYDSMTDTPTPYADGGNYAVLNPLSNLIGGNYPTMSNGNLSAARAGIPTHVWGTFGIAAGDTTSWYWEGVCTTLDAARTYIGIIDSTTTTSAPGASYAFVDKAILSRTGAYYNTASGTAGSSAGTYTSYAVNDVVMIAYQNGKIWFGKNGTWMNSGNPAAGTGAIDTAVSTARTWIPYFGYNSSWAANFGQRPFAYTPPTGFLPMHTGNLPDSTIVDGSTQMGILTYSGTNGDRLIATGETGIDGEVNFTPDLVWNKSRNTDGYGALWDSVRGGTNALQTYGPGGELNSEGGDIDSFVEGGTNFGTGTINASWGNTSGSTYVSWQWKAGTAFSNDAGTNGATIASVGSVNQDAGFSVVTYTGTGSAATVAHSLGAEPKMVIVKKRNAAADWVVKHASLSSNDSTLILNNPSNQISYSPSVWNNTAPTSSVFSIGTNSASNSANTFVAYCFADVEGYSKFGGYTGNGSTDGTFVHLGFRPKFILVKCSNGGFDWHITDTSRSTYNQADTVLFPNLPNQEANGAGYYYDVLSNGFKCRNLGAATNGSGYTYIYMAFAENPFKKSLAR